MKKSKHRHAVGLITAMLAALAFTASRAEAATSVNLTVTVTVRNVSIDASYRDTTSAFTIPDTVNEGTANMLTEPISITNSGNVAETYSVSLTGDPPGWSAMAGSDPSAADVYRMSGVFRAPTFGIPVASDFVNAEDDYSITTTRAADGANQMAVNSDTPDGTGNHGFGMATGAAGNVYLWLRFDAPDTSTVFTAQTITTQITAAYAP